MIDMFLSDGVRQIDEEDPDGVESEPPQPPPVAATVPPRAIRRRTEAPSGPTLPARSHRGAPESSENEINEYERRTKALVQEIKNVRDGLNARKQQDWAKAANVDVSELKFYDNMRLIMRKPRDRLSLLDK